MTREQQLAEALRTIVAALPRCTHHECTSTATVMCFDHTCAADMRCGAHQYEHSDIGGPFDGAYSRSTTWATPLRAALALLDGRDAGKKETP